MSKVSVAHPRRKKNAARSSSFVSWSWVIVGILSTIVGRFSASCRTESAVKIASSAEAPDVPAPATAPPPAPATSSPPRMLPRPAIQSCPTNKGQQRQRR